MDTDTTQIDASTVGADAANAVAPSQKTEAEKLTHTLTSISKRAKELGLDPAEIMGVKTHIETDDNDDDSKPVTVGMLRNIQKADAQKTAIQMAEEIADEDTRNTVKLYLSENVVPSGDAQKDFRFALGAASADKNTQVIAEIARYTPPKRTAAGGSVPANVEESFVPTASETVFMGPPYNLSKEKVLAARRGTADRQG